MTRAGRWAAVALGASIPLSVALDNVLLVAVAACWLAGSDWRAVRDATRSNPVALAALALFALLALGTLYGDRNPGDAGGYLVKYADLLFIPVFASLLRDPADRRRAILALAASLAAVLAASFLIAAGLPLGKPVIGTPANPVVLKHYLTHSILMAFAAFLFAGLAREAASRRLRLLWTALALAAAANVMLLIEGRTGYGLVVLLALYFGHAWRGWRGLAIAAAVTAVALAALAMVPGPFQQRMGLEAEGKAPSRAGQWAQASNRQRLEYYRTSLAIVREHPLIGVGTGGYPKAFAARVPADPELSNRNPHNEYLHIAVQIGLPGLAALLCLFALHWRLAARLATPFERQLARGLVLAIAAGCVFNSLLLDHTEGLLYAWLTGVLFAGLQSPPAPS